MKIEELKDIAEVLVNMAVSMEYSAELIGDALNFDNIETIRSEQIPEFLYGSSEMLKKLSKMLNEQLDS